MASRRPRRSRIYDSNYNIGENMYKSAIDRLDEKYSSTSATTTSSSLLSKLQDRSSPLVEEVSAARPAPKYDFSDEADEDLSFARQRASHIIEGSTILDTRTGHKAVKLENEFEDQIQNTLSRINASKKLLNSLELDNSSEQQASRSETAIKRRAIKVTSNVSTSASSSQQQSIQSTQKSALTKWQADRDYSDSESFAALRARQSAQRIQDIQQDIVDRNERQLQREARVAQLKKLRDSDYESNIASGIASIKITKSTKRVTTC